MLATFVGFARTFEPCVLTLSAHPFGHASSQSGLPPELLPVEKQVRSTWTTWSGSGMLLFVASYLGSFIGVPAKQNCRVVKFLSSPLEWWSPLAHNRHLQDDVNEGGEEVRRQATESVWELNRCSQKPRVIFSAQLELSPAAILFFCWIYLSQQFRCHLHSFALSSLCDEYQWIN